jgi:16S rRNA G1207 methylase RsmC
MINYFEENNTKFNGLKVGDLGCGQGLLGIYALQNEAQEVLF